MNALTCCGENSLPSARNRQDDSPMWRLTERTVRSGLVTAWRLATSPTSTSPVLARATTDGVVRAPSALGITVGSPPSRVATTELVVPRSIPTALAISSPQTCWDRFRHQDRELSALLSTLWTRWLYSTPDLHVQAGSGSTEGSSGTTLDPGPTPAAPKDPPASSTA